MKIESLWVLKLIYEM